MMTATEELQQWIDIHGSERDALNVALIRLRARDAEVAFWKQVANEYSEAILREVGDDE